MLTVQAPSGTQLEVPIPDSVRANILLFTDVVHHVNTERLLLLTQQLNNHFKDKYQLNEMFVFDSNLHSGKRIYKGCRIKISIAVHLKCLIFLVCVPENKK